MAEKPATDMKSLKEELDHILEAVSDESLPLDAALDYYERAVKLGMKATELMESGLADVASTPEAPEDPAQEAPQDASPEARSHEEAPRDQGGE